MSETGIFYGVGVGPGDSELLTLKAFRILNAVDVIFHVVGPNSPRSVSGAIVESHDFPAERIPLTFSMLRGGAERDEQVRRNANTVAKALSAGRDCAFATIGDPMVYSTYIYISRELKRIIPELRIDTVPGITSFQAAAAAANFPLVEDKEILRVVPASSSDMPREGAEGCETTVFLKTFKTKNALLDEFADVERELLYATHVGLDDEAFSSDPDEIRSMDDEYLSLLIVRPSSKGLR
ncbi:MAG: precorrin-2 C(20)-methyltransferase [Kiritimatiellaeota bacterium]|nr:precorrin-2 C(20)-methyltransferase [Kiritimatiellota bacterium]